MKTSTALIIIGAFFAVLFVGWWVFRSPAQPEVGGEPLTSVGLVCNEGKTIAAEFYQSQARIKLSDGREMMLPQVQAAEGIRYANADQSFIFWGKGNTAFVSEGPNQDQTYTGCIIVAPDPSGTLTQILATSTMGISIRLPQGYTVDQSYVYGLSPTSRIRGIKFTIPESMTAGTNLSEDSYVSVEELPGVAQCEASAFLPNRPRVGTFTDIGINYSVATSTGAAAGNIYDEAVFAIPNTNPCTAIRYFVHSTNIANYPEGTVRDFDRVQLITEFDNIRRSLVIGR